VSDALRQSARSLGAVVGIGLGASVVLGIALAVAQHDSVTTWIAYMLYFAGAGVIGFAFLAGTPPSPRKLAKQQTLDRAQARSEGRDPDEIQTAVEKPLAGELAVLVSAGAALFALGIALEVVT